jgi:hypothetical protein
MPLLFTRDLNRLLASKRNCDQESEGGEAPDARRTKDTLDAGSLLSKISPNENSLVRKWGAKFAQSVICFFAVPGGWR